MKRFSLREWAMVGFHYRTGHDYSSEFYATAKAAGFNVLMDGAGGLDNAKANDMKIMVAAIWYDLPKLQALGDKVFKHPSVIGFNLWDNASGLPRQTLACAGWLKEAHPTLIAYLAENPNPGHQARTPMPVLSTQNYAFGYNNKGPDHIKRMNYCNSLEGDRLNANKLNMTFWPIYAALAERESVADSEIRFQNYAAVAYGASGVMSFAYSASGKRPQWNPKTGNVYRTNAEVGAYINQVVGKHVFGCRSIGVYHTAGGGDKPYGALDVGPGKLIESMDDSLLAGVLVVEGGYENFKAGKSKPAYVMVVDKRTNFTRNPEAPARTAHLTFGPGANVVEILPPPGAAANSVRIIQPAWTVAMEGLKAGDGRLIRLDPPDLDKVLHSGTKDLYLQIVAACSEQRQKALAGQATLADFQSVETQAAKTIEKIQGVMGPVEGKTGLSQQSADILARLKAAVDSLRQELYAAQIIVDGQVGRTVFVGQGSVELRPLLKGAVIRHTLDGSQPTAASAIYDKPLTLKATTVLTARTWTEKGPVPGAAKTVTLTRVSGDAGGGIKINFGPKDAAIEGYMADSGELFGVHGDRAYGWNVDMTASAARRRGTDPLKSTQVAFMPGATWSILLDNGTYDVTVCIGDAEGKIENGTIVANDVEFCKDLVLNKGEHREIAKAVEVKDGRLTLKSHDRLRAGRLTRINYLLIRKK
ncbi:MAG: chitobiase/beta-hexosaminidase C-terminal domain-containing protein [Planctomycetaceae bacterium]|nr:chitobiase/beta-hexosaminidase C-terminal domain-containing protein [Planctomycetaceae bacterium]